MIENNLSEHDYIKKLIYSTCNDVGIEAKEEYSGKGWRADVMVNTGSRKIAFEVQTSPQSLIKTKERQAKYLKDDIIACWLFTKESRNWTEDPDLPLFKINIQDEKYFVSLKKRRDVELSVFVEAFVSDKIQFKNIAIPKPKQWVDIIFYPIGCWKCGKETYCYAVMDDFKSDCNCSLDFEEAMWSSKSVEYIPEIIKEAQKYASDHLPMGEIKNRRSNTVGHDYVSFGCYYCDSIFGDFHRIDEKMDALYNHDQLESFSTEISAHPINEMEIPHWCYPENGQFCKQ